MKVSWADFIDFSVTADLLQRDFVQQAVISAGLLAILGAVLGPFVVSRQMSFAVHGTSELSVTGAAAAMLFGWNINAGGVVGALCAALVFGLLGTLACERDSVIGVVLAFGLGLGVLFIALHGRTGPGFSLLTGQVISVGNKGLIAVATTTVIVLVVMAFIYRPLLFASTDPAVAAARGVPMRLLSVVFSVLLAGAVAQGVQIIGALLVMSLVVTPAAAAMQLTANPARVMLLALIFGEISALGGIVLSLAPGLPVSVFVTTISFLIYLSCRLVNIRQKSRGLN